MYDNEDVKLKRNLTALVEFSRVINSSFDLDFIVNNVLLTCMGKFFATRGIIALKNKNNLLELKVSKGMPDTAVVNFPAIRLSPDLNQNIELRKFTEENKLEAVEAINYSEGILGAMLLGEKLNKTAYSEDDIEFLRTIINISATAIQNSLIINELKKVNRMLDSRIQRLNSLFELSKEFGLFSDNSRVAKLLVYSVIGQFMVSKFAVVTFESDGINILESKFPFDEMRSVIKKHHLIKLDEPVIKSGIDSNYPELKNLNVDLIVPMQIQGKTKGLILLGNRVNNTGFSDTDIEFVFSIGSLAMISLENNRLFKEELEKQKIEEELEIARGIQKNLLPKKIPEYSSFEIATFNLSSKQVGGDYYDIISLSEKDFLIAIGDVSGKGVPAALLMANLQAFLRMTCKHGMQLNVATALINDLITENTSDGKFITFFWAIFDNQNKQINYINAGHNPPLLLRNGNIRKLDKGGIIFGVLKTITPYLEETIQLEPGDSLIFFTDGITEAMNKNGEEFSEERLEKIAKETSCKSAQDILESVRQEVQNFNSGTTQSDDITLIVVKVK
jgi:phosphoserine phosphatase RsbU/P